MVNDKAWQFTYRKGEFDENLRYVTAVISEIWVVEMEEESS